MAQRVEVHCSRKENGQVTGIGGINPNGSRWFLTEPQAIEGIEQGKWEFFIRVNGREVKIYVVRRNGRKHLWTDPDGYRPNNLAELPECPR